MLISKQFTFEAAHRLPYVPEGHKCGRLHGHSFRIEVFVSGVPQQDTGWIVDYAEIGSAVAPIIAMLDHNYLNEIPGLENPTSEILAMWIWSRLREPLPGLARIIVQETCNSSCIYEGD